MAYPLPNQLSQAITDSQSRDQRLVIMNCGISGAGKSTLAKTILATHPNFTRLSVDTYVYDHYGRYGFDFPAEKYGDLQDEAQRELKRRLEGLVREGKMDVVLDFSFYNLEYREEWRKVIRDASNKKPEGDNRKVEGDGMWGGKVPRTILVYFEASEEVLWRRVQERSLGVKDADSAAEISRELLGSYVRVFEKPDLKGGEGEVVVLHVE